ncbi:membrane protein [Arthrobacter phage Crewmate]|uniref:Membrane protein n=1 Tax=Arthrobacter phage Crewmate TaxID=2832317 RepID=A0AA49B4G9_9CAUD|nr:membrane protein [Arthrobacter phage Crewmate]UIW13322.1 membrane protein [Arthrobacter phage Crewmate]WGH21247.1 membrane protein [Arthrobacter phage ObiToo]
MSEAVLFALGVASWAVILIGSCAAVAAVYWIGDRWWKR